MSDYVLYYWSVPFRGQFVRAVLAYAGKTWTEGGDAAISKLMDGPMQHMPVPFMGPPMLVDKKTDFAIAQMPAIILYLGETLDLMPDIPALRAATMKIVNDANDVIDEIPLDGGRGMWTKKRWREFLPRLQKWMSLWEETDRRHGLKADSGFLLGLWWMPANEWLSPSSPMALDRTATGRPASPAPVNASSSPA
jgi:glutathione S-transferase